ncbi:MAG: hypothetical protein LBU09_01030 [Endomicrobium sp.]|jgi:hypothetical protein|nr:hypothetical protein [Endomicrobium sp.]
MHDSHKLWMWIAVFLVVLGALLGMFLTATPEKMTPVIEKQKALIQKKKEMQEAKKQKKYETEQITNEDAAD